MKKELRTMKRDGHFAIEERIGDGSWNAICECVTINEAKEILKSLRALEGDNE